jgi:nitroreductase
MELFEAISKRHSYRGAFLEAPVPREHLTQIVEAGLKAPSARNGQTTTFVIVDEPDLVQAIGRMGGASKTIQTAKAFIACIINDPPIPAVGNKSFEIEDCSTAIENMLLAITALGYATVWTEGWLHSEGRDRRLSELLRLPAGKTLHVILPVGVPAEEVPATAKKPFAARAWFNAYGG